jgi:uncharacterized protein
MNQNRPNDIPQYSLAKTLLVWALAAVPMGLLGWFVAPALARDPQNPGLERLAVLTVGLIWQFILILILLYQETGNLRWSSLWQRLWLNRPRSPQTGKVQNRLWWWLIPIIVLTAAFELLLGEPLDRVWIAVFPFFAEPKEFSIEHFFTGSSLLGRWDIFGLFVVTAVFNTVLGEELLFRGLLLPRMAKTFGKWDWVVNGVLFGLYHLHQPWGIFNSILAGIFLFALPSRYFRSSWFGIIAHSGQSVYFGTMLLALVLGLARV